MGHVGVEWVTKGWGESFRGGVSHTGVGRSCRGGVGHAAVGWVMQGWGGVGMRWGF